MLAHKGTLERRLPDQIRVGRECGGRDNLCLNNVGQWCCLRKLENKFEGTEDSSLICEQVHISRLAHEKITHHNHWSNMWGQSLENQMPMPI